MGNNNKIGAIVLVGIIPLTSSVQGRKGIAPRNYVAYVNSTKPLPVSLGTALGPAIIFEAKKTDHMQTRHHYDAN